MLLSRIGDLFRRPPPADELPRHAPTPRVLWIELTSKCPFDCVFCSRRLLRGGGMHMDMELYRSIVAELDAPEIIRLNYSGESTHHPHIVEAVRLAAATGAQVELVTALSSLPERLVRPLAGAGLTRLSLSLHTLDPEAYSAIYGYGSVAALEQRVRALQQAWRELGSRAPVFDLAFVAMQRNLDQLQPVAAFAVAHGAAMLSIHPVIRRDPIKERFEAELDDEGRLRPEFLACLREAVQAARAAFPGLTMVVSTPEAEGSFALDERPAPYPPALPEGARIHTCEQNPWDTAHILSDGRVVSCEVRDKVSLGRIGEGGLTAVWRGEAYQAFRRGYPHGDAPECRACPYKVAHAPRPLRPEVSGGADSAQLFAGWHEPGGEIRWGKKVASLTLGGFSRQPRRIQLQGAWLGGEGEPNQLTVRCNGRPIGRFRHEGRGPMPLDVRLPVRAAGADALELTFEVSRTVVPAHAGLGADLRALGFGLGRAAAE